MQLLKKHVTRTVVALVLGAGTLIGGSSAASAVDAHPQYTSYKCDDGRACVYDTLGQVWNMEHCGSNPIYGHFNYAKAHGNTMRVWYTNDAWDLVPAWSERTLDGGNKVVEVDVYC